MRRVAVLNVVGLSQSVIGDSTPNIKKFVEQNGVNSFPPAFPAVTCTAQSSYLTGISEGEHGIVGNGWYDKADAEVKFWKQSNHLVQGEKIWETLRKQCPEFTCAKLFWWYNMYSSADWTITPRPMYPADGRKVFDVYTQPMKMREEIKKDLGEFPFHSFWGPKAGLPSSEWIANSAEWIEKKHSPTLSLVYLPHLDYSLQKYGPNAPEVTPELESIDRVVGGLIKFYKERSIEIALVSEYGISAVEKSVHLNRLFREKGWIEIKEELGKELLDCGASKVFAVADHQIAHIYVQDKQLIPEVRELLNSVDGVEQVLSAEELWAKNSLGAQRGGDLIVVSELNAWFTYYYWNDDEKAPDFARSIDIHRKPGYDPVELFVNPKIRFPLVKIAQFLLKKKLGFRSLLDVIPLDSSLIKGSHGSNKVSQGEQPIFASTWQHSKIKKAEDVFQAILSEMKN